MKRIAKSIALVALTSIASATSAWSNERPAGRPDTPTPSLTKVIYLEDFEDGLPQNWRGETVKLVDPPRTHGNSQHALGAFPGGDKNLLIIGAIPDRPDSSPDMFLVFDYQVNRPFRMLFWVQTTEGYYQHYSNLKTNGWRTMVVRLDDMISRMSSARHGADRGKISEFQLRTERPIGGKPEPEILIDNIRLLESSY